MCINGCKTCSTNVCVFVLLLGMMIESMAGKSASLHGLCLDATPFTFSEDIPAVDYYGNLLVKGWYMINYMH